MTFLILAASRHNDDPVVMVIAAVVFLVLVIIVMIVNACENNSRQRAQESQAMSFRSKYMRWRRKINSTGEISSVKAGLNLSKGEECYFAERTTLREPRAVRVSRHSGYGVRPLRRVGIFEGESTSESHDEWRTIAHGVLYITNKRLVFAGDKQNRVVKIGEILTVETYANAIEVKTSRRTKSMEFFGLNGQKATDILRAIQNA